MIWHAEPQHGNPEPVQNPAERIVAQRVGVPLRHHHDSALAFRRREPAGINEVVFRIRRAYRRRESQKLRPGAANFLFKLGIRNVACAEDFDVTSLEAEVGRDVIRKEFVATGNGA